MWECESGRVFFVIIGILFAFIAVAVSNDIIEMDKKMAETYQDEENVKGPDEALSSYR